MFTKEKGTSKIQQLITEVKRYLELQKEYTLLEITQKLSVLLSTLILIMVMIILGIIVLFFLAITLAYLLAPLVGSLTASYAIIAGIVLILLIVIYFLRDKLIVNPMVNFLARLLFNSNK